MARGRQPKRIVETVAEKFAVCFASDDVSIVVGVTNANSGYRCPGFNFFVKGDVFLDIIKDGKDVEVYSARQDLHPFNDLDRAIQSLDMIAINRTLEKEGISVIKPREFKYLFGPLFVKYNPGMKGVGNQ